MGVRERGRVSAGQHPLKQELCLRLLPLDVDVNAWRWTGPCWGCPRCVSGWWQVRTQAQLNRERGRTWHRSRMLLCYALVLVVKPSGLPVPELKTCALRVGCVSVRLGCLSFSETVLQCHLCLCKKRNEM